MNHIHSMNYSLHIHRIMLHFDWLVWSEITITMKQCPGRYCGRMESYNGSDENELGCSSCPRGYRVDENSTCVPCSGVPYLYDWLYLGVMTMLPLVLNCLFIGWSSRNRSSSKALHIQYLMVLFECSASATLSMLLLSNPQGSFIIKLCPVVRMSDWYTIFFNPLVDHSTRLRCTQEAVYPLYSLPFIYYTLCVVFLALVRITSCLFIFHKEWRQTGASVSIYAALYFYPALMLLHAFGAGLMYYFFPFIIAIVSLVANALYLASIEDQTTCGVLKRMFTSKSNVTAFVVFSAIYLYCIFAAIGLSNFVALCCLVCLLPVPTLFYAFTVILSQHDKLSKLRWCFFCLEKFVICKLCILLD